MVYVVIDFVFSAPFVWLIKVLLIALGMGI